MSTSGTAKPVVTQRWGSTTASQVHFAIRKFTFLDQKVGRSNLVGPIQLKVSFSLLRTISGLPPGNSVRLAPLESSTQESALPNQTAWQIR